MKLGHLLCHPLDKVQPFQFLDVCFQAFGCSCRFSGLLPITVHHRTGKSEFQLWSKPMLALVIHTLLYIGLGIIYVPIYYQQVSQLRGNPVVFISEILFTGGQGAGCLITTILIPFMAKGVVHFWNDLMIPIEFLVVQGFRERFRAPYTRSRISLAVFTLFLIFYGYISWRFINPEVFSPHSLVWIQAAGYVLFLCLCGCHLLHAMIFVFFAFMLRTCFQALDELIQRVQKESQMPAVMETKDQPPLPTPSSLSLSELVWVYKSLCKVCTGISRTFGLYIVLELVVMMTSVLMNVFTIFSHFQQRDPFSTILSLLGYAIGLIFICESGERCQHSAKNCWESLRELAFTSYPKDSAYVVSLGSPVLTATNYFKINRRLTTAVAATFATYFVVIIQFKLNSYSMHPSDL